MLYCALACAKTLLELLQETAARIYLRLSVTPCSAAVRAQHFRRPQRGARRARSKTRGSQKKQTTKGYTLPSTYGFNMVETLPHSAKL